MNELDFLNFVSKGNKFICCKPIQDTPRHMFSEGMVYVVKTVDKDLLEIEMKVDNEKSMMDFSPITFSEFKECFIPAYHHKYTVTYLTQFKKINDLVNPTMRSKTIDILCGKNGEYAPMSALSAIYNDDPYVNSVSLISLFRN